MYDIRSTNGPLGERSKVSEQLHPEPGERSHRAQWIAIGVLAAAIGGVCWYGYPALRHSPAVVEQLSGFEKSLERVNTHLAEAQARIKDWGRSQQELQDHVAKL